MGQARRAGAADALGAAEPAGVDVGTRATSAGGPLAPHAPAPAKSEAQEQEAGRAHGRHHVSGRSDPSLGTPFEPCQRLEHEPFEACQRLEHEPFEACQRLEHEHFEP
jgi:hypothetical protein